jgi:hypothetical protein
MNKYQESKIYKIIADETNIIYIGSTVQKLYQRFSTHKRQWDDCKSKEMFNYKNPRIELIEQFPCNNRLELLMREQYYIELYKDICINKIRAYSNDEQKKNHDKQYQENHRDQSNERAKLYYEHNKEHVLSNVKKYREANKDKIKERLRQQIICECGTTINRACYSSHVKTKKHIDLLATKNL